MSSIKFFKVTSLPAVLEPNSVYLVNTDGNLNIHISDNTGASALQLSGGGLIPYPIRKETPKIVGDIITYPLTTQAMITRRLYFIPFITPRKLTLTKLGISIINQSPGNAAIGIYSNTKIANGNDNPHQLLTSVTLSTGLPNGYKTVANTFTFKPNTLYWVGIMCSSAPILRALNANLMASSLGRVINSNTGINHLYKDNATFGLPALGPTNLLSSTSHFPCIYLVE